MKILEIKVGKLPASVDDEGDPEDFSIDYYLELLEWDDSLIAE